MTVPDASESEANRSGPSLPFVLRGVRASASLSALVLASSMVGYGAFCRDVGIPLEQVLATTLFIWALPAQMVLVASMMAGASWPAAAIAVALTSVRLLPMTVSLLPLLTGEKAKRGWLYLASHVVAITAWVEGQMRLRDVPAQGRMSYFLGLGFGLLVSAMIANAIGYLAAGTLPKAMTLALLFLTPMFFLSSLIRTSTTRPDQAALLGGLVLGPIFHLFDPEFDLLWAGLVAGTLAFGLHRWQRRGA